MEAVTQWCNITVTCILNEQFLLNKNIIFKSKLFKLSVEKFATPVPKTNTNRKQFLPLTEYVEYTKNVNRVKK